MSETTSAALKLQQFKCPSCGQNITQLTPFKASVECPYCHQVSLNPLIVNKSMRLPERVIPFTVTQDDFGEQIIEALVDEKNLPLDLFNQITFDSLIKAYLPMYEYSGNFEATWSCDERYAVEKQRMRNNQVETYKEYKYRPAHGDAYGNFSILCLAYSGEDVPQELQDFASAIDNPGASSYEYDPSLMGLDEDQQIITLEMNLDPRKIWSTFGRQYVEQKAAEECGRQAPSDRKNLRTSAKAINFGIMYGKGAFSLSRDLNVPVKEAEAFLKTYLNTFPKVDGYMKDCIAQAKETGYVSTLFGRRRPLPELASSNFQVRSSGERMARNTPIQGTAADIIKLAMVHVWQSLRDEGLKARLLLQVHDELIVEAPIDEVERVKQLLKEKMEQVVQYSVPLTADVGTGKTWLEAH